MRNFRDDRRSGGHGFGGRDSQRHDMHETTCSACGRTCEVPFKPKGDKPVYCNDCFRKTKSFSPDRPLGRDKGRHDRRDSRRFDTGERKMYEAVCSECGEPCEVPFKPSEDKPVYCDECFGASKSEHAGPKKADNSAVQFEQLNAKLDKIIKVLELIHPKKQHIIEKSVADAYMKEGEPETAKPEGEDTNPRKKPDAQKPKKASKKPADKKTPKKKK